MSSSSDATQAEQVATQPVEAASLTAADRCDACGAQAYIRVTLPTGELLFCAHHGKENKAKLETIAITWHDESDRLVNSK
jgi:hypothetical protein